MKQAWADLFTSAADTLQHPEESQASHILSGSHGYQRATSLLIAAVNQSDSGTYSCYAYNEKGASDTAVRLDIRGECWKIYVFDYVFEEADTVKTDTRFCFFVLFICKYFCHYSIFVVYQFIKYDTDNL